MKIVLPACLAIALSWVGIATGQTNLSALPPSSISIYKVPLVCPAVPQIGCGSRAKPILLALERERVVESAWLNRSGTLLAIVWKRDVGRSQGSTTFKHVIKKCELTSRELKGVERKEAMADFLGGQWLNGAEVDRLSEEEAKVLAGRLIRKIRGVVALTNEQASILQAQLDQIIKNRLTGELSDRETAQKEVIKALRGQLEQQDVKKLQEVLKDYRPGQDDQ